MASTTTHAAVTLGNNTILRTAAHQLNRSCQTLYCTAVRETRPHSHQLANLSLICALLSGILSYPRASLRLPCLLKILPTLSFQLPSTTLLRSWGSLSGRLLLSLCCLCLARYWLTLARMALGRGDALRLLPLWWLRKVRILPYNTSMSASLATSCHHTYMDHRRSIGTLLGTCTCRQIRMAGSRRVFERAIPSDSCRPECGSSRR